MLEIKYNLTYMLYDIQERTGKVINLSTLSQESGVNRNMISRLRNHPNVKPGTDHVEKLLNYYVSQLINVFEGTEEELYSYVLRKFITYRTQTDRKALRLYREAKQAVKDYRP